jgi:hypothetical protein
MQELKINLFIKDIHYDVKEYKEGICLKQDFRTAEVLFAASNNLLRTNNVVCK